MKYQKRLNKIPFTEIISSLADTEENTKRYIEKCFTGKVMNGRSDKHKNRKKRNKLAVTKMVISLKIHTLNVRLLYLFEVNIVHIYNHLMLRVS